MEHRAGQHKEMPDAVAVKGLSFADKDYTNGVGKPPTESAGTYPTEIVQSITGMANTAIHPMTR